MKKINFTAPARPQINYPIIVEQGALDKLPTLIENLHDVDRIIVLYDKALESIANRIAELFSEAALIAVPSGEESKLLLQVERIIQDMLIKKASRRSVLINVGGGVLTDIGGFIASVYMRGIRFIHVPTSLLCMTDAAIGGTTAINVGPVKNMIGTVYHPEAVVIDTDVLAGLPDEMLRDGMVEVVKMAAILDAEFFGWLEENIERVINREEEALNISIQNAARMKTEAMAKGDLDDEVRLYLNFGHTVGHAVETLSKLTISHGKAVSIGMVCEMKMAGSADSERIIRLLEELGMPLDIPLTMKTDQLWDIMLNDKKTVGGDVRIAIPDTIASGSVRSINKTEFTDACK